MDEKNEYLNLPDYYVTRKSQNPFPNCSPFVEMWEAKACIKGTSITIWEGNVCVTLPDPEIDKVSILVPRYTMEMRKKVNLKHYLSDDQREQIRINILSFLKKEEYYIIDDYYCFDVDGDEDIINERIKIENMINNYIDDSKHSKYFKEVSNMMKNSYSRIWDRIMKEKEKETKKKEQE